VSTQPQVEIGSEFLGYRIEEVIGQGGMGVVYRAYDLRLNRAVALKLVAPELALDDRFRDRFARESEVAMSLEHPNVVPIYDAGDIDGRLYLAMRHVEGTDLRALLRVEGPLEPARALAICGQVAAALDAAHARGLVHRDVKPSNVLLDQEEHVYLADFGLSRRLAQQDALAGEGRSVGTPAYLAPEQIEGKLLDGRADLYSLGCLLHECLTGEAPFSRGSRLAIAWAHLEEEPPRASERNRNLPSAIDGVLRQAMAKSPEERYPTCTALIGEAEEALGIRDPRMLRRRRLAVVSAAATLVVLAAALAVALITRSDAGRAIPAVRENTVVRIDPTTNAVSDVIDVGSQPSAVAVAGRSVWVYNQYDHTVTEIDARTTEVRQTAAVSAAPVDLGLLTGPVLDADAGGAWLIGVDEAGRSLLTRVLTGGGVREYFLDQEPRAVAVGRGSVWVVVRGTRIDHVLRINAATGKITARTGFPVSSRVDSLDVGLGGVWAVSSSSAVLYRIDPRSAAKTGHVDLGQRAGRPNARFGFIWVGVSDHRGGTLLVDPRTLVVAAPLSCCPLGEGYETATGYGSIWYFDHSTGTLVRWDGQTKQIASSIPVAAPPVWGGPCLTSVAAGADGVWVTVAPSPGSTCHV
jgi:DNA-binding beta-propeller fold protein YncE